jgi:DNA topoisomerase VI subunit A
MAAFLRVWFILEIVYALCAYGISATQRDIFYSLEPTGWFENEDVTLKAIRGAN